MPKNPKKEKESRIAAIEDAYDSDDEKGHGYRYWERQLASYKKIYDPWEKRCDTLLDIYTGANSTTSNPRAKYNIFFSVVQTLVPAIYARTPRPDVTRRFKDNAPAARVAAMILERALEYEIDHCADYRSSLNHCVFDFLTAGRGCAWVRYEPHIKAKELDQPTDGVAVTEDIDEPMEELIGEESKVDYVHFKELCYTGSARTWEEVTWVGRYVYMDREAVIARFGEEIGKAIPLDAIPESRKHDKNKLDNRDIDIKQAEIVEIWCKQTKMAYWISKSMGRIIDKRDDPLGLPNFFPTVKPLFFGTVNDSLVPNPLYVQIQDACMTLNTLSERQRALVEGMKLRGVYDAQFKDLGRLLSEGEDNSLVPVANYSALSEKGGLNNAIQLLDMTQQANALKATFDAMAALQQQVYDLSGVSDVMRGMSDPTETATAQAIKSVNGQNRLKTMQLAVASFAGDLLKIKANLICKQYSDETIFKISGAQQLSEVDQQLLPQALMILRNDPERGFKVEVSADSLILLDEQQEKTDRMEFIGALGGYFQQALPMVQETPELAPLAIELLKFAAAGFKAGKTIEGILDQTAESFREQVEQMKGQPKPPPMEVQIEQLKQQGDAQKMQAEQQAKAAQMQMEMQAKREEAQLQAEVARQEQLFQAEQEREKNAMEDARLAREFDAKMKFEERKLLIERNTKLMELHYKNTGAISVEQIKSGASSGEDDEQRELELAEASSGDPFELMHQATDGATEQLNLLLQEAIDHHGAPKQIIRDENGMAIGSEIVAPQVQPIMPNEALVKIQKLPDHSLNKQLSKKALSNADKTAQLVLQLIDTVKRPRKAIRGGPDNRIIGVE